MANPSSDWRMWVPSCSSNTSMAIPPWPEPCRRLKDPEHIQMYLKIDLQGLKRIFIMAVETYSITWSAGLTKFPRQTKSKKLM